MKRDFSVYRISRFLVILTFISLVFLPAIPATVVNPDSTLSLRDQIRAKQSTLDSAKAEALASQSNGFQSMTRGLGFSFNSIFNTWSYSYNPDGSLNLLWKDVNVVYTQHFANGSATNAVVTEDPGLTAVMNVTLQRNVGRLSPLAPAPMTSSSNSPQVSMAPIQQTTQASPTEPSTLATSCETASPKCAAAASPISSPVAIVQAATSTPDFSLSASVTQMSFTAGGSSTSTITLTSLNGFVGSIAVVPTISPNSGNVPSTPLNASSITLLSGASGSATLQVLTSSITVAQSYSIIVTATSGTLIHSVSISLTLNSDVQISADAPSPSTFFDPGSSTATIHVTSIGLAGTLTLTSSISPSPANAPTASFNPGSLSVQPGLSYASTLTVSTTPSTPSGTYTVTVTASGATTIRSTTVTITLLPDFQISPGPVLYLGNGNSGTSSVSLSSLGLSGGVSLSSSSPNGITASFVTNPVSLSPGGSGSSLVGLLVPSTLGSGSYGVTITGSGPSSTHSTTLTVNVCDRSTGSSTTDADYFFNLNCSRNALVLGAKSSWTVPSVSEPSYLFCYNRDCDVTISSALADGTSPSALAVFAGSLSNQHCGFFGCDSPKYYAFYDYLPNNLVQCTLSVNSGDSITGETTNNFVSPSQAGTSYFVTITDSTKGMICSTGQPSSMGSPYYAQFQAARPGSLRLPRFSSVTVTNCQVGLPTQYEGCSDADYAGFSIMFTMVNGGNTNVSVSTISANSFTFTYNNSNGM